MPKAQFLSIYRVSIAPWETGLKVGEGWETAHWYSSCLAIMRIGVQSQEHMLKRGKQTKNQKNKQTTKLGVVMHICNLSTWEAGRDGSLFSLASQPIPLGNRPLKLCASKKWKVPIEQHPRLASDLHRYVHMHAHTWESREIHRCSGMRWQGSTKAIGWWAQLSQPVQWQCVL